MGVNQGFWSHFGDFWFHLSCEVSFRAATEEIVTNAVNSDAFLGSNKTGLL